MYFANQKTLHLRTALEGQAQGIETLDYLSPEQRGMSRTGPAAVFSACTGKSCAKQHQAQKVSLRSGNRIPSQLWDCRSNRCKIRPHHQVTHDETRRITRLISCYSADQASHVISAVARMKRGQPRGQCVCRITRATSRDVQNVRQQEAVQRSNREGSDGKQHSHKGPQLSELPNLYQPIRVRILRIMRKFVTKLEGSEYGCTTLIIYHMY